MIIDLNVLSGKSIKKAITEINNVKKLLNSEVDELLKLMLQDGVNFAIKGISNHIDTGETISSIFGYRDGNKGVIVAGGASIWLEFGTGVIKNSVRHPVADELGIKEWGTYGHGNGANPNGWYYPTDDVRKMVEAGGKLYPYAHTTGVEATMFMYNSANQILDNLKQYAQKVFKEK